MTQNVLSLLSCVYVLHFVYFYCAEPHSHLCSTVADLKTRVQVMSSCGLRVDVRRSTKQSESLWEDYDRTVLCCRLDYKSDTWKMFFILRHTLLLQFTKRKCCCAPSILFIRGILITLKCFCPNTNKIKQLILHLHYVHGCLNKVCLFVRLFI